MVERLLGGVTQRLKREMVLVKGRATRLIELSIGPAGLQYDRPVRKTRRGGDDLMLNDLPPFSPPRGLTDTPTGPQ